jgi:LysR family hydrogen peroxide-inducible transcriptional activator
MNITAPCALVVFQLSPPFLLTDFVQACQKKLPELALFLREDMTENLMNLLNNGEIDLLILASPILVNNFYYGIVGKD